MNFPHEGYALKLQDALKEEIKPNLDDYRIYIHGAGVHWYCHISHNNRSCNICCFDKNNKAQYYIDFREKDRDKANARTEILDKTVKSICEWINGCPIQNLYDNYYFVDKGIRELKKIEQFITSFNQELMQVDSRLKCLTMDIYKLRLGTDTRDIDISFYGDNEVPDYLFRWDKCELFKTASDNLDLMSSIVHQWLCKKAMPSKMRELFPFLEIGTLADYYEAGKPIEGEFIESWDKVIEFFKSPFVRYFKDEIIKFISDIQMDQADFERKLRAGQAMLFFIVSRSRRHGLLEKQSHIVFDFSEMGINVKINFEVYEEFNFPEIKYNEDIREILLKLTEIEID